ncbi:MAG: PhnE/PtxC family ABC transporter permease [Aquiluna sp.]|jgi:phosphonate transport system permease protein
MRAEAPAMRDPAWIGRVFWGLAVLVVLLPSLVAVEFKPWMLFEPENLRVTAGFVMDFFPPEVNSEFLFLILRESWTTIAIATAGMALAMLFAVPFALAASSALSISSLTGPMNPAGLVIRQLIRWFLIVLRSVPELIWALIFVRVVGLGPAAGVLAIAVTYTGMLGKIYGEILESGDTQASRAVLIGGGSRLQAFFYGLLPQNATEISSYTVYRWECAIRSSAVLGFVGAGGLGQQMDASMKMFNGGEVATILIVLMVLVAIADLMSAFIRKAIQ